MDFVIIHFRMFLYSVTYFLRVTVSLLCRHKVKQFRLPAALIR